MSFITCDNLVKIYKVSELEVVALQGMDLQIESGEVVALIGPSGSGKSTFMNMLGALDTPSAGRVQVGDYNLATLRPRDVVQYRRETVGFVWQQTTKNLIPYLTASENIEFPMALNYVKTKERKARVNELLEIVGMAEHSNTLPERLSGGEKQRIALAIALANRPQLLLADEPTGELDSTAAGEMYDVMKRLNAEYGVTIVIVTHDHNVSNRVNRVIGMRDGRVSVEVLRRGDSDEALLSAEEFAVLDRTGRLQLPHPYLEKLNMKNLARVILHDDHIAVYPLDEETNP